MTDRWRVGRSTRRTIWYGEDVLHGMVDTPAIAERICEAMNEVRPLKKRVAELESAAKDLWPLVDEVRAIVADHYPDGTRHDDPEYTRRRSVTAALVRQALALRNVIERGAVSSVSPSSTDHSPPASPKGDVVTPEHPATGTSSRDVVTATAAHRPGSGDGGERPAPIPRASDAGAMHSTEERPCPVCGATYAHLCGLRVERVDPRPNEARTIEAGEPGYAEGVEAILGTSCSPEEAKRRTEQARKFLDKVRRPNEATVQYIVQRSAEIAAAKTRPPTVDEAMASFDAISAAAQRAQEPLPTNYLKALADLDHLSAEVGEALYEQDIAKLRERAGAVVDEIDRKLAALGYKPEDSRLRAVREQQRAGEAKRHAPWGDVPYVCASCGESEAEALWRRHLCQRCLERMSTVPCTDKAVPPTVVRKGDECETCGDKPCDHFLEMLADIEGERAWIYNLTNATNVSEAHREAVNECLRVERKRLDHYRNRAKTAEARVKELEAQRPETASPHDAAAPYLRIVADRPCFSSEERAAAKLLLDNLFASSETGSKEGAPDGNG